jgi:hypothetical protein
MRRDLLQVLSEVDAPAAWAAGAHGLATAVAPHEPQRNPDVVDADTQAVGSGLLPDFLPEDDEDEVPAAGVGAAPDGPDPDELMVTGVTAYLRTVRADPGTWTVILLPPLGAPPRLREHLEDEHRLVLRHLRLLLEWGLARRGGPAELDVDLFARSVLTLAEGAAQLLLRDPERYPVERFERYVRVLVAHLGRD